MLKGPLKCARPLTLTHELRRLSTVEGAPLAVGGALGEDELRRVNVVFVRQPAVDRLAGHLLGPLPVSARDGHRGVRLKGKDSVSYEAQDRQMDRD